MKSIEKKRLCMFLAIAYGLTAIMTIFMVIAVMQGKDVTAFVNTQMTYPACGVILGLLLFRNPEKKLPVAGFITFLSTAAIMLIISLISVFAPENMVEMNGSTLSIWNIYSQYVLIAGSVVAYILFWICGKEKRKNAGLSRNNVLLSAGLVLLFVVLYFVRILLSAGIYEFVLGTEPGATAQITSLLANPYTWVNAITILINFPLTFIAFLGEEYGWRYYFQGVLQKKFGLRGGVIILGLLWGVWHIAVDFTFYTSTTGLQMFISQLITCVSLGIFFGYVYMKTSNIWAIALMHFINNNYIVLLSNGDASVLQNQVIEWYMLPVMLVQNLVFILFILAPTFNKKEQNSPISNEVA